MKVFKNPNRGKNQHVTPEPYVPEYQRLNKTPIPVPTSREEFRRKPTKLPEQVRVNSGQDVESVWIQNKLLTQPSFKPPVVVAESKPNTRIEAPLNPSQFYNEPLASAAIKDFSVAQVEYINDSEVDLPERYDSSYAKDEEDVEQVKTQSESNIDFVEVNTGEYIFMYDNDMIASGSLEEITEIVENVLTSDEYNVIVEKIVILKKMNLRTGVLISD